MGGRPWWLEATAELEAEGVRRRRASGTYSFLDRLGLRTGGAGVELALLDGTPNSAPPLLPSIMSAGLFVGSHTIADQAR